MNKPVDSRVATIIALVMVWAAAGYVAVMMTMMSWFMWATTCTDFDGFVTRPCDSWPVMSDRAGLIVAVLMLWGFVGYLTYSIIKKLKRKKPRVT